HKRLDQRPQLGGPVVVDEHGSDGVKGRGLVGQRGHGSACVALREAEIAAVLSETDTLQEVGATPICAQVFAEEQAIEAAQREGGVVGAREAEDRVEAVALE